MKMRKVNVDDGCINMGDRRTSRICTLYKNQGDILEYTNYKYLREVMEDTRGAGKDQDEEYGERSAVQYVTEMCRRMRSVRLELVYSAEARRRSEKKCYHRETEE